MTFEERDKLRELLEKFVEAEQPMLKPLEALAAKVPPMQQKLQEERTRIAAALELIKYLRSGDRMEIGK